MKAAEVLNRYATGQRDFRYANLRGQSFKGQDLSGADFTDTDIRGTNFTNAILKQVNFTEARAGVQRRWIVCQLMVALVLSTLLSFVSAVMDTAFLAFYFQESTVKQIGYIPGIVIVVMLGFVFLTIAHQDFTTQAIGSIAVAIVVTSAVAAAGAGVVGGVIGGVITVAVAGVVAVAAGGVVGGVATVASAGVVAVAIAGTGVIAGAVAATVVVGHVIPGDSNIAVAIAIAGAGANALLSGYITWRALKGDEKFALFRSVGIAFVAIGGTTFCGADLTDASFTKATLKSTNFTNTWKKDTQGKRQKRETVLEWVCWHDVKRLDRARVGNSILANSAVRELLVTRNGCKKSYVNANLRASNLNEVNLEQANLRGADLSYSILRQANLRNAELTEALVVGTNLMKANLTGACLEDWNISSYTNLEGVDCQYVYLLRDQQERRPSSGDFAPGEFTKLFQEALNTVDLIFRNGVDWKAFVAAFQTVQVDNDGTELTIQSIENKGDGVVVVRVSVPETADKAKLHSEFNQNYDLALKALEAKYHAELKAKDEQIIIYREKSADMTEILRLLANRPVTVEVNASAESKAMSDSIDKSQSVNIGGNVIGSTVNLGAISGSVTNAVNQLSSAPDPAQPGIKELLIELQAAIESDADLPEKGKASALEHVKVLAEVAQDPEQPEKKGLGSQAVTFFKNAASFLPDTAKLAEACTKLLPLITKALGLPF